MLLYFLVMCFVYILSLLLVTIAWKVQTAFLHYFSCFSVSYFFVLSWSLFESQRGPCRSFFFFLLFPSPMSHLFINFTTSGSSQGHEPRQIAPQILFAKTDILIKRYVDVILYAHLIGFTELSYPLQMFARPMFTICRDSPGKSSHGTSSHESWRPYFRLFILISTEFMRLLSVTDYHM